LGPLTGAAGMPRRKYRQRCSSSRGVAALGSVTLAADHKRSATVAALGHVVVITFVASIYSK
ncbi:unnamed protein product, partial [Rotaria magnacalcarata]